MSDQGRLDCLSSVIHDEILAQHLCPQISIIDTIFQPITSKNARGHYRQHPLEFKHALVALSLEPAASAARIARNHGVNASQVFSWRRLYEQGRLGVSALMLDDGLLPVVLAPATPAPGSATSEADGTIVLEQGEVQLRIEGQPNASTLAQVLDRVLR
ncbi:IS66-like element accessory protein TnpA [Pseudoduganella aquatica]|uniref:IS66-like element accessory protein TnpA n=1 Tax=Pseudoduganella aquatica TaxID=2660641 RepID=UPI001E4D2FFD|nr:transposase [Pseudoduganella aquatica]